MPDILNCKGFVNTDDIAHELSPFNLEDMAVETGRLMLKRIKKLLKKGETFAIETTQSTKSYISLVHQVQERGYLVTFVFFWLRPPELAMQCVVERIKDIPVPTTW